MQPTFSGQSGSVGGLCQIFHISKPNLFSRLLSQPRFLISEKIEPQVEMMGCVYFSQEQKWNCKDPGCLKFEWNMSVLCDDDSHRRRRLDLICVLKTWKRKMKSCLPSAYQWMCTGNVEATGPRVTHQNHLVDCQFHLNMIFITFFSCILADGWRTTSSNSTFILWDVMPWNRERVPNSTIQFSLRNSLYSC